MKVRQTAIIAGVLLCCGTVGFGIIDGHSFLDGLYLTTATLTTIGFGDIVPSTPISRIFTCALQLCGLAIFTQFLTNLGEWRGVLLADHSFKSRLSLAALTLLLTQAAGTLIFVATEGIPFVDGLYLTFTVSTSVGYGDLAPKTDAGKICFIFFSLLTMAPFGFVVEFVGDTIMGAAFPAPPTEAATKKGKSSTESRKPAYKEKVSGTSGGAGGAGGSKAASAGHDGHDGPAGAGDHRGEEDATPQGWAVCWGLGQPVCVPALRVKRD